MVEWSEVCKYHSYVVWAPQKSVAGTTEICGGHHRNLWWAPQKSVAGTTEICGGHLRNLWWAPQKSVVDSRRTEFSERKRKQVLSYGEKYLLNGRCYSVDTYMYEHMLHKVSIAESPNKGCNRVLLLRDGDGATGGDTDRTQ